MKRIIAATIGAAMLGGAVVAQEVTFYNRLGSVLVEQAAVENADADFGKIYDRIVGQYDSEKFSFFGRFGVQLHSRDWDEYVELGLDSGVGGGQMPEFNGAMRPLPFLELALGNSYGTETPWEGYELPGSYGYGSDVQYGRGYWADGNGGTILFKGAGIGVDGLYVGWNVIPMSNAMGFKGPGIADGWDTQIGIIYNVDGLLGIGAGAKLTTRKWEEPDGKDIDGNQQFGVYVEFTGVENLKVGAGVTMDTNGTGGFEKFNDDSGFVQGGVGAAAFNWFSFFTDTERDFAAFVNAGAEYNFAGMGLPITLGADVGLFAGRQTVQIIQGADDVTMMPLLVGALIRVDPMENLWFDVRGVYEDALISEEDANISRLIVTPRVHFLLSESDEFRLQAPITTMWTPDMDERRSDTGFNIEIFWQHNF